MKAVQLTQDRSLEVVQHPDGDVAEDEVRVAVGFCGICGTDLHMRDAVAPGAVFGHEIAGTVSEIGDEVSDLLLGEQVAVIPYTNCGTCSFCLSENESLCLTGGHNGPVLGAELPGGFAESVIVKSKSLFPLPKEMSLESGAFVEPAAVSVRAAATVADICPEEPVVVVGAGPIGLLTAFALKEQGNYTVSIIEQNPVRADIARDLGLQVRMNNESQNNLESAGGQAPVAVIECAGSIGAANLALKCLQRQGRLVLVGLPAKPSQLRLDLVVLKEIRMEGSAGYARNDFQKAIDLLASGAFPVESMITRIVSMEETEAAFRDLTAIETRHVKVLIQP